MRWTAGSDAARLDAMPEQVSHHFRRIDPTQNMRRFYALDLQPTLFGEVSLTRHWGRIGTAGQFMIETFGSVEDAERVLKRLVRSKRSRGYADA